MSKICENCGNMIPDGTDVCPGCGREIYDDAALQSILGELSIALDEIQEDVPQPARTASNKPVMDSTGDTRIFGADQVKAALAAQIAADSVADAMKQARVQEPVSEPEEKTPAAEPVKTVRAEKPVEKKPAAKTAASGKKNSKKKKKKKKKNSGGAILGVIIGLILALLLVAGAALFMLHKMGFFELMSDDQLLQTTPASTQETLAPEMPSVAPEAPVVESVVEESIVEEPVAEERPDVVEPELSIEEPEEPAYEVEVKKFNLTGADDITLMSRGETAEIVFVISPEEAEWDIEWTSSDETVATVSPFGVITARRGGSCVITGSCGGFEVTVDVYCAFTVPTTVLDMNYDDITMDHEGQEVQLKIDYDLDEEYEEATIWETTDENVATVDENGVVTAVGDGTAIISAAIGDYTASCIVRCVNVTGNRGVNPEDSEYVINYEDVTLTRKGEYFQLSLKSILGKDVPDHEWTTTDSGIAKVDDDGVVTAVGNGTCYIRTTCGGDDFECIVRVRISG